MISQILAVVDAVQRFSRQRVQATKERLLREAKETALAKRLPSTLYRVIIQLRSHTERRAAWELGKEGMATMRGDVCVIAVDTTPPAFRRLLHR